MGKPGAKKMDQIVSVTPGDVHIIMVPSPGGPVPTPIPHPCTSIIKDKVADKVKVMGQPGAVKGSISKHTPPHIPMGPGPFQKPPANKGEIVTASSNVFYEGKEAAMLGDTGKMCADPSDAPVGKVIGTAATVLIGGGGGGSDEAREQAAADAMKAAAAECHKWINANMPPGADREQAHREVCTATGHPIDVATGKMFTRNVDLTLHGRIPFEFVRNYSSARSDIGVFGHSWRHSYEIQLVVHRDFIAHRDANGRFLPFEPIAMGEQSLNKLGRLTLRRIPDGYIITTADGGTQFFPYTGGTKANAVIIPIGRMADRFGNRLRFDYTKGKLVRIEDSAGRIILFEYNQRGFICALCFMSDMEAATFETIRAYRYSEAGDLVEVQDEIGNPCRFEYANHLLVKETDRCGFSFYFTYDEQGWCLKTWGDGGILYRRFDYDRHGQQTKVIDSLGRVVSYCWNAFGVVVKETDVLRNTSFYEWNEALAPLRVQDPVGNVWTYTYDDRGRLVGCQNPEGSNVSYAWDDLGRPISYTDPSGHTRIRVYDDVKREAREIDPEIGTTTEVLNELGDLVRVFQPNGGITSLEYDLRGTLVSQHTPAGLEITRRCNVYGDLISEEDQYGKRLIVEYDRVRRIARLWRRNRGSNEFSYDNEGRVISVTDANGQQYSYEYVQFNRLHRITKDAHVTLAEGSVLRATRTYSYDSENRVVSVKYHGGDSLRLHYDGNSRPMRVEFPDGRIHRYERDGRGYVSSLFENDHLVFTQTSDSLGRVLHRSTGEGDELTFEYDPSGNLVAAFGTGEIATVEITRDLCGRRVEERGEVGVQQLGYTESGSTLAYRWSDDLQLRCEASFGQAGIQWAVFREGHNGIRIQYDSADRVQNITFPKGEVHECHYVDADIPSLHRVTAPGAASVEQLFSYDPAGWLVGSSCTGRKARRYERDELNRLVSMTLGEAPTDNFHWEYDRHGDRVRSTTPQGAIKEQRYAFGHRPMQLGPITLGYDDCGRVVSLREGNATTQCQWNSIGQLQAVHRPDGSVIRFRYDALGRRVAKVSEKGVTEFGWAGNQLIHEKLPDGEERHYLYYPESFRPLACYRRVPGGDWEEQAFLTEPPGIPWRVTKGDGRPIWEVEWTPWGEKLEGRSSEGIYPQFLALPGQYRDEETGFHYNFSRYYLPSAGVYLSPDPAGLDGGDDPYAYVADPVCWVDPMGLSADDYKVKLGLGKWGRHKAEFDKWAIERGLKTYGPLSEGVRGGFPAQIDAAMKKADEIHFNLKGVDTTRASGELNDFGEPARGYTNYELHLIKTNTQYRDKVIWYDENGNTMPKGWMPPGF